MQFLTCVHVADELASLEELHLWHTSTVHADLFEFVYASRFHVRIPCTKFKPLKDQIQISKTKEMLTKLKDQFPRFTDLTITAAQQRLASSPSNLGIRQVNRFILNVAGSDGKMGRSLIRVSVDRSGFGRLLVGMCTTAHTLYVPLHQVSCFG